MKTETSAGGVVVKKRGNSWHVLLMRDMSDTWTFPKGLIEKGEQAAAAAKREIAEEVGLRNVECLMPLDTITYFYQKNGRVKKTVHYFLFRASGNEQIVCQKNEGIKAAKWVEISKTLDMIGYPKTNKPLIQKTQGVVLQLE